MDPDPADEVPPVEPDEDADDVTVADDGATTSGEERRLGPLPDRTGPSADDAVPGGRQHDQ